MTALLARIWIDSALIVAGGMSLNAALTALTGETISREREVPRFRPERFVFRHHRGVSLLLGVAAAGYLTKMYAEGLLWPGAALGAWTPILRSASVAMALLLPLAATLFVRPSLLRPAEARLNRWIGPPERPAPRWLRLAGGLYCFPALIWLLAERMN
ncbi:MAG: hypothetical protein ACNS61_15000 [Candidatus Wenzhouxiangella sp. M2_3B_020]